MHTGVAAVSGTPWITLKGNERWWKHLVKLCERISIIEPHGQVVAKVSHGVPQLHLHQGEGALDIALGVNVLPVILRAWSLVRLVLLLLGRSRCLLLRLCLLRSPLLSRKVLLLRLRLRLSLRLHLRLLLCLLRNVPLRLCSLGCMGHVHRIESFFLLCSMMGVGSHHRAISCGWIVSRMPSRICEAARSLELGLLP